MEEPTPPTEELEALEALTVDGDSPSIAARVEALEGWKDQAATQLDELVLSQAELKEQFRVLVGKLQHSHLRFQMDAKKLVRAAEATVRNGHAIRKEVSRTNTLAQKLLKEAKSKG